MKKYIFIDIDGTLTNSKREVSLKNIKAMNKIEKKDFEIVFCSGRCNNYLINLSKTTNISRYLISSNGSMIYDQETKKIIHYDKIPFMIIENIYNYCHQNKIAITFNTEKFRYCNNNINYSNHYQESDTKRIKDIQEIIDKNITQICIGSYDYDKMIMIKEYLDTIKEIKIVNISTTMKLKQKNSKDGFFYDVVLKNINKGSGIKNFIKKINTTKENCIAIGDHINDIDMFNAVNYKIAMGNAYDELKKQANYITKTNDEDGVKYALEHIANLKNK